MFSNKVSIITLVAMATIFVLSQMVEAGGEKGDTIIMGSHGCQELVLKTGKKGKGNVLLMNECKKKEEEHHYPKHEYHEMHHYGGDEYGHEMHGYEHGYGGDDSHGYGHESHGYEHESHGYEHGGMGGM
ncbi:hypothetical protein RDWZM_007430 [Blomia tropicalis]|uniref:Uncharacterized protein n=1 Tax=Blomia tropicalis TaxID=40697 RepID=A0A9Q0LXE1_BLOTA|nr:hypothetical protein BLOT_015989 [Blomia tropicalis]KAJ6216273.1 hypothetical protein RDWZM_007430 [Blomia tropicalis]